MRDLRPETENAGPSPLTWVADAVFYQVFPDRFANGDPSNDPPGTLPWGDVPTREAFFGGDLEGVIEHLDYLQDLGITALYLNPIFAAGTNHRYDTWDYFSVDPNLGGIAALERLVAEVHRRGMRVILDGVFNHCGEGFAPFADLVAKGADSGYRDWFIARSFPILRSPLTFMTCSGAPYLPKLNTANGAVRDYILKVARYWTAEIGIDGWRLDVPYKVARDFWAEFREAVKSINPNAYIVGEVWREPAVWLRGDAFDGTTNYRLRELLLDYCAAETLDAEDFAFEAQQLMASCGPLAANMLNLMGSHDTPRILTRLGGDAARLRIGLTFLMTIPGAPLVYYGDEVGMLGDNDPDCRRPMLWSPDDWHSQVLDSHRRLITLRREHQACRYGEIESLVTFNGTYAYRRAWKGDEIIVVLNPRESVTDLEVPTHSGRVEWQELFSGEGLSTPDGVLRLPIVPARSAQVFVPR